MTTTEKYQEAFRVLYSKPFTMTADKWTRQQGISKRLAYEAERTGIVERRGRYLAVHSVPSISVVENLRRSICGGSGRPLPARVKPRSDKGTRRSHSPIQPKKKVGLIRKFINWIY